MKTNMKTNINGDIVDLAERIEFVDLTADVDVEYSVEKQKDRRKTIQISTPHRSWFLFSFAPKVLIIIGILFILLKTYISWCDYSREKKGKTATVESFETIKM